MQGRNSTGPASSQGPCTVPSADVGKEEGALGGTEAPPMGSVALSNRGLISEKGSRNSPLCPPPGHSLGSMGVG